MPDLFNDYFDYLGEFGHGKLFQTSKYLWDPLNQLATYLPQVLAKYKAKPSWKEPQEGFKQTILNARGGKYKESCLFVEDWFEAKTPIYFASLGVWIGQGTILEPTAIIKGPTIIGEFCEIRQGAYLRGNVLIGKHCIIGHATEIKIASS